MSKINETNYPRRTQANYADTDMLVIQAAGGNTYTTRLEDMREDYEETLAPTLSALQDDVNENLATIEESTASKAYAKGDFLVFGGRLCKAKTSIAVNATLVLDTNIELASVGGELSSITSDLASALAPSYSTSGITFSECTYEDGGYAKIGKIVIFNIRVKIPTWAASSALKKYFDLPSSIYPVTNVALTCENTSDNVVGIYALLLKSGGVFLKGTTAEKTYTIAGVWLTS